MARSHEAAPASANGKRTGSTPRQRRGGRTRRNDLDRRWCLPPAILREPDETLEGSHIFDEVPGDTGLRLWTALRDVTLWAGVAPEKRLGLFRDGTAVRRLTMLGEAGLEPGLEVPLGTLAAVVSDPDGISDEVVCLMCLRVSAWAEARQRPGTALVFAQAGALASPEAAGAAYTAGRLALAWGRLARAETWLRRTSGLARRTEEWGAYAEAYADLGTLYALRGAPEVARRHFLKAFRAARRHGLLHERARALHGLFRLARDAGAVEEAERLARAALRGYDCERRGLGELQLEVATLHMARGRLARAAALLEKALQRVAAPEERLPALAMLARAAAGTGDGRRYEEAWNAAWTIAAGIEDAREHAGATLPCTSQWRSGLMRSVRRTCGSSGSPARSGPRRSVCRSPKRQGRSWPSAVSRMRLQRSQ
jgi:hypothetical protein